MDNIDKVIAAEKKKEATKDQSLLKKKRSQKQAAKQRMDNRTRAEKHEEHLEIILNYLPAEKHDHIRACFFDLKVSEVDFCAVLL